MAISKKLRVAVRSVAKITKHKDGYGRLYNVKIVDPFRKSKYNRNVLANMEVIIGDGKSMDVVDTSVSKAYRGKGIGKKLFQAAANFAKGKGKEVMVGSELRSSRMVEIRRVYKTRFFHNNWYNGKMTKVDADSAKKIIDVDAMDGTIKAKTLTSSVPKMKVSKPKSPKNSRLHKDINARSRTGVRFIRKNGRIIPIRVKK